MTSTQAVCPLCGASEHEVVYDLTAVDSPEDVPGLVVRCMACPMWFKVLLRPDGIPSAYPGEHGDDPLAATYLGGAAARALFRHILAGVRLDPRPMSPRLLDIGAGQAVLLEEAVRMGFDAEGIDHCAPNARAASAKGFKVIHEAAENLDARDEFDVITLLDVIEHMRDPVAVLRRARRALKPGGELVVYTPNHRAAIVVVAKLLNAAGIRYPIREIFGRNHVCFFDNRSLPLALRTAGLEPRSVAYAAYDPARPGQEISRLNLLAVTAVEWLGRPTNRVFRMLAFARKAPAGESPSTTRASAYGHA